MKETNDRPAPAQGEDEPRDTMPCEPPHYEDELPEAPEAWVP